MRNCDITIGTPDPDFQTCVNNGKIEWTPGMKALVISITLNKLSKKNSNNNNDKFYHEIQQELPLALQIFPYHQSIIQEQLENKLIQKEGEADETEDEIDEGRKRRIEEKGI